jgi:hypothetical protein
MENCESVKIMDMVEIFRTNVKNKRLANRVLTTLNNRLPVYAFNFDLDDCDRILRAQSPGTPIETTHIIQIVKEHAVDISLFEE